MMTNNPPNVAAEKLDLPLEFMKLRKAAIFFPLLTTSLCLGALAQAVENAPNIILGALIGVLAMAVLWSGAISQRRQTERLRRYLRIERL